MTEKIVEANKIINANQSSKFLGYFKEDIPNQSKCIGVSFFSIFLFCFGANLGKDFTSQKIN